VNRFVLRRCFWEWKLESNCQKAKSDEFGLGVAEFQACQAIAWVKLKASHVSEFRTRSLALFQLKSADGAALTQNIHFLSLGFVLQTLVTAQTDLLLCSRAEVHCEITSQLLWRYTRLRLLPHRTKLHAVDASPGSGSSVALFSKSV